jgi:uncharacterized protein (TIGR02147 family)
MKPKAPLKPYEALLQAFHRKKEIQPAYSQRAFARDIGVSAVFANKLFKGIKPIPSERVKRICKVLGMDPVEEAAFMRSLIVSALPLKEMQTIVNEAEFPKIMERYRPVSQAKAGVLRHWYTIAVLNILTCDAPEMTPKYIAKRLNITESEAQKSLDVLSEAGLATKVDGVWKKTAQHDFFPTAQSLNEVRAFHHQMIRKAQESLLKISPDEFERRLITGFTVAANPEKIADAKMKIFEILADLSQGLVAAPCSEVYQLNVQLFPLTLRGGK